MSLRGLATTTEELDALKKASKVIRNGNYHFAADFEDSSYYSKGIAPATILRLKDG